MIKRLASLMIIAGLVTAVTGCVTLMSDVSPPTPSAKAPELMSADPSPSQVPTNQMNKINLTMQYRDINGDVSNSDKNVSLRIVQSTHEIAGSRQTTKSPTSVSTDQGAPTDGTLTTQFPLNTEGVYRSGRVTIEATLEDMAGKVSNPVPFSITVGSNGPTRCDQLKVQFMSGPEGAGQPTNTYEMGDNAYLRVCDPSLGKTDPQSVPAWISVNGTPPRVRVRSLTRTPKADNLYYMRRPISVAPGGRLSVPQVGLTLVAHYGARVDNPTDIAQAEVVR